MIQISGPHKAVKEGTCNGCDRQVTPLGTKVGAMVFTLRIGEHMVIRLCGECKDELIKKARFL